MRKFLLLGCLVTASVSAAANESIQYHCKLNNAERIIEVVYASTDKPTPCTVNYTKDGATETLWSYENTQGQCEAKATEFSEKQSSWGWSCSSEANSNATTTENAQ